MPRFRAAVRFGLALSVLAVPHVAFALLGETPTIRAAAAVRGDIIDPKIDGIALIGEVPTGAHQLVLRSIDKETGRLFAPDQVVTFPQGVTPVDVIFSTVFRAGSILVLDDALRVHQFPVAFDAAGHAKLIGDTPTILGPFGDPALVGAGMALAEAPRVIDPKTDGFLGIGTAAGWVLVVTGAVDPMIDGLVDLGAGAITGLGAVPQVGSFVFVAAHQGRAVGVNPAASPAAVVFSLADPRPDPLLDLSTGLVDPKTDGALPAPAPVSLVAANGTTEVAVLQIPAGPTIGGTLTVDLIDPKIDGIRSVARGSLLSITAAGAALYDPGFTLAAGGSGVEFALAGASLDVEPDVLNVASNGRYVTAYLEVANGAADAIDRATLALRYDGGTVATAGDFAPQLGDFDEDGLADVMARFDREAVEILLAGAPAGVPVRVAATWTYSDGSAGSAWGVLRIKR